MKKKFIADLHIHSRFSRATSPKMDLPNINCRAQLKGIDLIGTGDFTHPEWFDMLNESLVEDGEGFYKLKKELQDGNELIPEKCQREVHFLLSAEVALIYKRGGKCRKVHHLIYMPDLQSAKRLNVELAKIGNIAYDGRPILGLDSMALLELILDISPDGVLIPAHAWTPHFAIFGSKTGFDSIEECFLDLSNHIFAIETGLSSDPSMNRLISDLDKISLISNSDAHSLGNLGREANHFNAEFSYRGLMNSIRSGEGFLETFEFLPEEGKYHYDGHRKCNCSMAPEESAKLNNCCPVCGKKMTLGVLHRVSELADRKDPAGSSFKSIVPLMEIVAGVYCMKGTKSQKVQRVYLSLLEELGDEFTILTNISIEKINEFGERGIAKAINDMRAGRLCVEAGYDGVYGSVSFNGK